MGEVVPMPVRPPDMKVIGCGCGAHHFILVFPNEVYCPACDSVVTTLTWSQTPDG